MGNELTRNLKLIHETFRLPWRWCSFCSRRLDLLIGFSYFFTHKRDMMMSNADEIRLIQGNCAVLWFIQLQSALFSRSLYVLRGQWLGGLDVMALILLRSTSNDTRPLSILDCRGSYEGLTPTTNNSMFSCFPRRKEIAILVGSQWGVL